MLAKGGLILLIAAFGALLFGAGAVAPDSLRRPIGELAQRAAALVAPKPAPAAPKAAESKPPAPGALPWSALLVPTPAPAKGRYALLAGQFANAEDAEARAKLVKDAGLAVAVLAVTDAQDKRWSVVAAGNYDSSDDARAARRGVAPRLHLLEPVPVILLPPSK